MSKKNWGGPWTEEKLDAFEKYVKAYLTIMNSYRDMYGWKLLYFDGFAGSGSRTQNEEVEEVQDALELFGSEVTVDDFNVYQGAAERVVKIERVCVALTSITLLTRAKRIASFLTNDWDNTR